MKILIAFVIIASFFILVTNAQQAPPRTTGTASQTPLIPPMLPTWYQAKFVEWTALNATGPSPPYVNGIPPTPANKSDLFPTFGQTYYDWTTTPFPSMTEIRYKNCINIFPFGSNIGWSCQFLNTGGLTYLLFENQTQLPGNGCCVFGDPWSPPPPDFLRNNVQAQVAAESLAWEGRGPTNQATWFIIPTIAPPTGPFYYSFTQAQHEPTIILPDVAVFDSFSFGGMTGWIQQNFFEQSWEKPSASVWKVPPQCTPLEKIPNCGFFGVDHKKVHPFGGLMQHKWN